jgi:hypothetical protein
MQKTNLILTTTPGLQDKIERIKRYRENSFVSLPLTYGKLFETIVLRGYLRKRDTTEDA